MGEKTKQSFTTPTPTYSDNTGSDLIGRMPAPKYWPQQVQKCQDKKLVRTIHQARCNPDYQKDHPAECRHMPEGKGLVVHPEAKIRVLKELATKIKNVNRPLTPRTPRYNRS